MQVFCRNFWQICQAFPPILSCFFNGLTIWSCAYLMHGFSSLPLQRIFCQASCRSLQVFCRFFAGRLQTFQTFRRLVVTWVCNGLTIWSCTFLMHGFSSLPLQRIFFISAKSLARSKVFGVGSVCKHWGQNKFIPRPHLGGHASCIRASLTPTFPPLWGLEVGAHSLMHAEF